MQIQLNEELVRQLEEIANNEGRSVDEIVQNVLEEYFTRRLDREQFRAKIRRHMQEHAWLMNELAKR